MNCHFHRNKPGEPQYFNSCRIWQYQSLKYIIRRVLIRSLSYLLRQYIASTNTLSINQWTCYITNTDNSRKKMTNISNMFLHMKGKTCVVLRMKIIIENNDYHIEDDFSLWKEKKTCRVLVVFVLEILLISSRHSQNVMDFWWSCNQNVWFIFGNLEHSLYSMLKCYGNPDWYFKNIASANYKVTASNEITLIVKIPLKNVASADYFTINFDVKRKY